MFKEILLLVLGLFLLVEGADFFVKGASGIATKLKIPRLVIGLTIVAIGTSLPELSVNLVSSIQGKNELALGNIIGSNTFDILFVLGFSTFFGTILLDKETLYFDLPILCGIYAIMGLFMFVISPNVISLFEGIILLILCLAYLVFLIYRSKKKKDTEQEETSHKIIVYILYLIFGGAAVVFGGTFVCNSSSQIAISLGMSEMVVGLTIVAIGTSLPELVTSVVAIKKGEKEIAVGNAVGSCIFNVLLIIGLSATINPISFSNSSWFDYLIMCTSIVLLIVFALCSKKKLNWPSGMVMLLVYITYTVLLVLNNYYAFI